MALRGREGGGGVLQAIPEGRVDRWPTAPCCPAFGRSPSLQRLHGVTQSTLVICAVIYYAVGLGGYLAFRHRTAGDILRNFGGIAGDARGE